MYDRATFLRRLASGVSIASFGTVLVPEASASPLTRRFAGLRRRGDTVAGHVFMPGETIPWPLPVEIGRDWSLRFADQPAITFLHSLGLSGNDAQLTIVSNNVLLERLDDGSIDYLNDDRQAVYTSATTPDAAVNVWRVRPALTSDRSARTSLDKLLFEVGGPLRGFTLIGDQIRRPNYRLEVAYRLNWYRGGELNTSLVDPAHELCVSELPLDRRQFERIVDEVALFRKATIGAPPLVMVSDPARLVGPTDSFAATYDASSGVAVVSGHYLTATKPGLTVVLDQLLGAAIFGNAATSPIPKLSHLAHAVELSLERAKSAPESLRPFAFPDHAGAANAGGIFAAGLAEIRRRPVEFEQTLSGLNPAGRHAARELKNAVIAVVRAGLELNGHGRLLHRFAAEPIQRL